MNSKRQGSVLCLVDLFPDIEPTPVSCAFFISVYLLNCVISENIAQYAPYLWGTFSVFLEYATTVFLWCSVI